MNYDLKIFAENIEPEAVNQIYELIRLAPFESAKARIMPDVHYGKGCVVGFLTVKLGKQRIDLKGLDKYIRDNIPLGSKRSTSNHSDEYA